MELVRLLGMICGTLVVTALGAYALGATIYLIRTRKTWRG